MEHYPSQWGAARMDSFPARQQHSTSSEPITHTKQPIVTGTSVVAVKYCDGVMMATDCLASYGSLARFRDVERMVSLGDNTLMGSSGDISDFQSMISMLKRYHVEELCRNDGHVLSPRQWFTAICAYMYQRRSKMDPIWNNHVVAGIDPRTSEILLGAVDLKGTFYESDSIATGFGAYLAQPLLRDALERKGSPLTEDEARELLTQCMTVLWYRDARSTDKIQMARVTKEGGVQISEPFTLPNQKWNLAKYQFSSVTQ